MSGQYTPLNEKGEEVGQLVRATLRPEEFKNLLDVADQKGFTYSLERIEPDFVRLIFQLYVDCNDTVHKVCLNTDGTWTAETMVLL